VVVVGVAPGSAADDAGIQTGDVIKEVNREVVKSVDDYNAAMKKTGKNKPLLLLLKRGAQAFYVTIRLS
jgi:serine protease Do